MNHPNITKLRAHLAKGLAYLREWAHDHEEWKPDEVKAALLAMERAKTDDEVYLALRDQYMPVLEEWVAADEDARTGDMGATEEEEHLDELRIALGCDRGEIEHYFDKLALAEGGLTNTGQRADFATALHCLREAVADLAIRHRARGKLLAECDVAMNRTLRAHDSDNNGAYMGEAVLCPAFAFHYRDILAKTAKEIGA